MGEHGARDDVPYGKDVAGGRLGLEVFVHDDAAALVQLHADRVQAQSVPQEGPPACMQPCSIQPCAWPPAELWGTRDSSRPGSTRQSVRWAVSIHEFLKEQAGSIFCIQILPPPVPSRGRAPLSAMQGSKGENSWKPKHRPATAREVKSLGCRRREAVPTCGDEDDVRFHGLLLAAFGGLNLQLHAVALHGRALHLVAQLELQALLRQGSLEGLPDLAVLQAQASNCSSLLHDSAAACSRIPCRPCQLTGSAPQHKLDLADTPGHTALAACSDGSW